MPVWVTASDHERIVDALCELAPSIRSSRDRAWTRAPALRVIDCVLSLNRNYDRFVVPRLDRFERDFPQVQSVGDLYTEITKWSSPQEFVSRALRYNHEACAITLGSVPRWLVTISGKGTPAAQLANVETWAKTARFSDYKGLRIRGFGLAGFQYLRMLWREHHQSGYSDLRTGRCGSRTPYLSRSCALSARARRSLSERMFAGRGHDDMGVGRTRETT